MPSFLVGGYADTFYLGSATSERRAWFAIALVALYLVAWCSWTERIFWFGSVATIWASAAIIFSDDGWRTLHVSHAYVALLLASTLSVRRTPAEPIGLKDGWLGAGAILAVGVMMISVPGIAHYLMRREIAAHPFAASRPDQTTLLAGRRLTGIAVFPDGVVAPEFAGRSMSLSEFRKLIEGARIQDAAKGPFLERIDAEKPFAFVLGASPEGGGVAVNYFITPVSVLGADQPWAWRLISHDKLRGANTSLFLVIDATPIR